MGIWETIIKSIFKDRDEKIVSLSTEIKYLNEENKDLSNQLSSANNKIEILNKELNTLKSSLIVNTKEIYYNNKYPKADLTYERTETDGVYQIDLRNFINPNDSYIPVVEGNTDDEKALNGLKWVINNIKYVSDISSDTYKKSEYWAYSYQTLKHKKGDCEDGAILLYNILLKSGVPYWKLRLNAGDVNYGGSVAGHCYLVYYCESQDSWKILDWCYYPSTLPIDKRVDYKLESNYKNVWFSWNRDFCFTKGLNTNVSEILYDTGKES